MKTLPAPLHSRVPRLEDAAAIVDLISACQLAEGDVPDITVDELLHDWHGVDLGEEAILVLGPDGDVVGYADILQQRYQQVNVYLYVREGPYWQPVWAYLTTWGEDWASERMHLAEPGATIRVYHFLHANNRRAQDFLTNAGYTLVRTHYVMEAQLDSPPPAPIWPEGIALRTFRPGEDDDALFEIGEAAFQDIWNRLPNSKERWLQPTQAEGFDPSLWFLPYAVEDGEIAGLCLCSIVAGVGMVDRVGVRRRWRRQGLGLAMLRHAFGEFWRRGLRASSLNVDAESPTGAPRLYERAGFYVQKRFYRYEKTVPGAMPLTLAKVAAIPDLVTSTVTLPAGDAVLYRPLLPTDVERLAAFLSGLSAQTRRFWVHPSYDRETAQALCDAIGRYDKLRLVAVKDDAIIAVYEFSMDLVQSDLDRYAGYGIELNPATDCRFGPCVADEYQGTGLAQALFSPTVEIARRFGQRRIILWGGVFTENERAVRFYEKLGFQRAGEFVKEDGPCYDMIYTL